MKTTVKQLIDKGILTEATDTYYQPGLGYRIEIRTSDHKFVEVMSCGKHLVYNYDIRTKDGNVVFLNLNDEITVKVFKELESL